MLLVWSHRSDPYRTGAAEIWLRGVNVVDGASHKLRQAINVLAEYLTRVARR